MSTTSTATADPVKGRSVLITGANRGLGRSLVEAALGRGARRVYAAARGPLHHSDPRVTPLRFDLTDEAQIAAAAKSVPELDMLVNNAGLAIYGELSDRAALERQLAVNLFGPYTVTHAFQHLLTAAEGGGTLVNVLSLAAVAPVPSTASYSISKAAAFSMTQTLRMTLGAQGVRVHSVLAGPIDTEMARGLPFEKAAPSAVAQAIYDGVAAGAEDIFPDAWAAGAMAAIWSDGPAKVLERQLTALAAQVG